MKLTVAIVVATCLMPAAPASAQTSCFATLAHRGYHSGTVDEETLAAISAAAVYGAAEIDLHVSADDKLIVIHNATVDATTNGTGYVHDLTLDQIRKLRTEHGYRVPTFWHAARRAAHLDMTLVVDLKESGYWTPALYARLDRIVARAEANGATIYAGGLGIGFITDLPLYTSVVSIYWRPDSGTVVTPAEAAAVGADMVMARPIQWTSRTMVDRFHRLGYVTAFRLSSWYTRAERLGVDYVLTNDAAAGAAFCDAA